MWSYEFLLETNTRVYNLTPNKDQYVHIIPISGHLIEENLQQIYNYTERLDWSDIYNMIKKKGTHMQHFL